MRYELTIDTGLDDVGEDTILQLQAAVPDEHWLHPRGFFLKRTICDPSWQRVSAVLKSRGCVVWNGKYSSQRGLNDFKIRLDRKYSKRDYDTRDFLVLGPKSYSEGLTRTPDGLIMLDRSRLKRKADFAMTTPTWIVASSRVKRLIEESPLTGITFRETVPADCDVSPWKALDWGRVRCEPFWEIYSQHILPPMAPWNDLTEHPKSPGFFNLREGLYLVPEPHYRRSDVASLSDCDLFGTLEKFDAGGDGGRMKIASKRFYQFCRAHELKISWTPVRLDPDSGPEGGPLPHYPPELLEFLTPPSG